MARNDCPLGSINGGEFGQIVVENEGLAPNFDCVIVGVSVGSGGILARNVRQLTLINSYVQGSVRVVRDNRTVDSSATIVGNIVKGADVRANIVIQELLEADVRRNTVTNGDIRVIDDPNQTNQFAEVLENRIRFGNLRVNNNLTADVKDNTVVGGNITCRDNINVDPQDNVAVGGKVVCSRSFCPGE